MKRYNIVYKTTNNINGKEYIGVHSTNNLNDGYLGGGQHIRNAILKYGEENFSREILKFTSTPGEAFLEESILVDPEYVARPDTYNLRCGGSTGCYGRGYKWTQAQKDHIRKIRPYTGENNPNYGKGYKQSGIRNGRHRENFKGDIKQVGANISNALKASPLNKKENNPASKLYHLDTGYFVINIRKGYLHQYCEENGLEYLKLYGSLMKGRIRRTKHTNCIGMQLFGGWSDGADAIY